MSHLNIRFISLKWLKGESTEYGRERDIQLGLRKAMAISNLYRYVNGNERPT